MILLKRLDAGMECLLRENQCGFRPNRSCIDQIYSLHTIIHNRMEFNIPLCTNFVDFRAAFDSIRRDFIWKSMEHYGLPEKYIRIFQAFFRGTMSQRKTKYSEENKILYLNLFNQYQNKNLIKNFLII